MESRGHANDPDRNEKVMASMCRDCIPIRPHHFIGMIENCVTSLGESLIMMKSVNRAFIMVIHKLRQT
jgi:hypothetical protein